MSQGASKKVTGIGGVFFKAADPAKLKAWYCEHLGVGAPGGEQAVFEWRDAAEPARKGMTTWAPFPQSTRYFDPSGAPFMINYRVADLDALLAELRAAGVTVDDKVEVSEYGKFGWAMDPEGNRIELWQPPEGM